ncbi:MAG: ECF transporter S component, partial [Bacillota bacterium]
MRAKMIVYTAIFIALGIILPITFHYLGTGLGAVFLPMHLPVLLGGAILGSFPGIIIGILTPILSSIFTGMPPLVPMVPIMVLELGLFGLVIGYLYKNKNVNIYICLILTMIAGRIGAGIMVWILIN